MMTTAMTTMKSTGLARTGGPVRQLATRLERARQSRNEKVARADADYVEAVRRALAAVTDISDDASLEEATTENTAAAVTQ